MPRRDWSRLPSGKAVAQVQAGITGRYCHGSPQHHSTDPSHSHEDGHGYLRPDQRHMGVQVKVVTFLKACHDNIRTFSGS